VISPSHKFIGDLQDYAEQVDALEAGEGEEEGTGDAIGDPCSSQGNAGNVRVEDIKIPQLGDFRVIVKTKRFDTIGAIPDSYVAEDSVQGLFINKIDSLDDEESSLIQQSFPGVDISNVLILEADRRPAAMWKLFGMIGGGVALCLLGTFLMLPKRASPKGFPPEQQTGME